MKNVEFKANRVVCAYKQKINGYLEVVFPLLCPEKETLWLSGWDYEMVWSKTGYAEKNCIFLTKTQKEKDTIWVNVIRDYSNGEIEFLIITQELRVTNLNIKVKELINFSEVDITYTSTSLNEDGNRFLTDYFSKKLFEQRMKEWERSMNHYILTGEMLLMNY